jgi:hypothetical protein
MNDPLRPFGWHLLDLVQFWPHWFRAALWWWRKG